MHELSDLCQAVQLLLTGMGTGRLCETVHSREFDETCLQKKQLYNFVYFTKNELILFIY